MLSMYVKGRVVDGRYNVVWRRREGERERGGGCKARRLKGQKRQKTVMPLAQVPRETVKAAAQPLCVSSDVSTVLRQQFLKLFKLNFPRPVCVNGFDELLDVNGQAEVMLNDLHKERRERRERGRPGYTQSDRCGCGVGGQQHGEGNTRERDGG